MKSLSESIDDNSRVAIFGYSKPFISYGDNWNEALSKDHLEDFTVMNGSKDYEFKSENKDTNRLISDEYEKIWKQIYKHFRFDRSILDNFYKMLNFEKYFNV
jgi:dihydroorotase